jgi:hexosaminidase
LNGDSAAPNDGTKLFYVMMNRKIRLGLLLSSVLMTTFIHSQQQPAVSIIPQPERVTLREGTFALDAQTQLVASGKAATNSAQFLAQYLKQYYGLDLAIVRKQNNLQNSIRLAVRKQTGSVSGQYTLESSPTGVMLQSADPEGLFYAMQSLIQLLPPAQGDKLQIASVSITDKPRFSYRGMHLDVARHMFPVSFIKRYIDFVALHKMNYFHIHLTDDQGWRLESKKYPQLNSIGSWREGTIIGLYPGTGFDSTRYGGYYTQKEMKEIVRYAAKRYITVVPEIDIPGHSLAVLASFPQFATDTALHPKTATTWGIFNKVNNVLAPSDELFVFLKNVYEELMQIFPSPYIHIGADECAHKWWKSSPVVQEFIAKHNLKDEKGLQRYFVEQVSAVIRKHGRTPIGWDDMLDDGKLADGITVMSWRNATNGIEAAKLGHNVIMTPFRNSYFNVQQRKGEERLAHKDWLVTASKVYNFEPVPDSIAPSVAANILGGQGCLWTEYFADDKEVEYGIFPRMSAIAEVYWSDKSLRDWNRFKTKMEEQFFRYRLWDAKYCNYLSEEE